MKLVSVKQMKILESQADQAGLSYAEMMANAGRGMAQVVHRHYFKRPTPIALGLVGSGNNGGDTLVALRHLAEWGWQCEAYIVKGRGEQDEHVTAFLGAGGSLHTLNRDESLIELRQLAISCDVILDGILGTGAKLPLKGEAKTVLAALHAMADLPPVVAVDCPSGVNCDSGKAAKECLPAELTVCMAAVKQGLLQQPALGLAGEILAITIDLPDDLPEWEGVATQVADAGMVAKLLPERPSDSNKGTFGTATVAAGSINFCGAVLLASKAAYRVGAGLVRTAIPGAIYDALAGQLPEATWLILPHSYGVLNEEGARLIHENLEKVNALLIGPGWGQDHETLEFLKELLSRKGAALKKGHIGYESTQKHQASHEKEIYKLPTMVIDADALKLLSKIDHWGKKLGRKAVLTPHPGEMSVLTGLDIKTIQAKREKTAAEFAKRWGQVVVLKGAVTVVADADGTTTLIPFANAALATAGTGDVLAGIISGLIAQGMEAYPAAVAGAWLHAKAGILAARKMGNTASVMAGDVLDAIPAAITNV